MDLWDKHHFSDLIADAIVDAASAPPPRPTRGHVSPGDAEWAPSTLRRAATLAAAGSAHAAARALIGQPPVPPSPDMPDQMGKLFITQLPPPAERARALELHDKIKRLPPSLQRAATAKDAAFQADAARPAAGPGPSGWRNSYISLIRRTPRGPLALADWSNLWSAGTLGTQAAASWTAAILRPFYKPSADAEPTRPIACSEALLKHALAVIFRKHRDDYAKVLGPEQYGAGACAGAPALVRDVRAIAALRPERAILQLDLQNAFGTVRWADALADTLNHVPSAAPVLATMWGPPGRGQTLYVESGPAVWQPVTIHGGVPQGGPDAQPTFTLCLARVLAGARVRMGPTISSDARGLWYVDDATVSLPPENVGNFTAAVAEAAGARGMRPVPEKCSVHVPAWRGSAGAAARDRLHAASGLRVDPHRAALLGSVCHGRYHTTLYPGAAVGPAQARLDNAARLARAVRVLADTVLDIGSAQAAWLIFHRKLPHALDFDSRACPVEALRPLAQQLDRIVQETALALIRASPADNAPATIAQMRLP